MALISLYSLPLFCPHFTLCLFPSPASLSTCRSPLSRCLSAFIVSNIHEIHRECNWLESVHLPGLISFKHMNESDSTENQLNKHYAPWGKKSPPIILIKTIFQIMCIAHDEWAVQCLLFVAVNFVRAYEDEKKNWFIDAQFTLNRNEHICWCLCGFGRARQLLLNFNFGLITVRSCKTLYTIASNRMSNELCRSASQMRVADSRTTTPTTKLNVIASPHERKRSKVLRISQRFDDFNYFYFNPLFFVSYPKKQTATASQNTIVLRLFYEMFVVQHA